MEDRILKRRIAEELRKLGVEVEEDAKIRGDSRIVHNFDIKIREKLNKTIVIGIAKNKIANDIAVLNMQIKLHDTKLVGSGILLCERFTEKAKKLADLYKIALVEGGSFQELIKGLKDILSRRFELTN